MRDAPILIAIGVAACGAAREQRATAALPHSASAWQAGVADDYDQGRAVHEQVAATSYQVQADAAPAPPSRSAVARGTRIERLMRARRESSGAMLAQLDGSNRAEPAASSQVTANDGRTGPLLVYEAQLGLAVYKVDETQRKAIEIATAAGGYLVAQDELQVVLRVPAASFQATLTQLEGVGDVRERRIKSEDVTAEFRDLNVRLRNAEQVRDRLAALLAKADDAPAALAIEKELDRVTEQLERFKGELRLMEERIAFSKITLLFAIKKWETLDPDFRLPFEWLQNVGLQQLLSL